MKPTRVASNAIAILSLLLMAYLGANTFPLSPVANAQTNTTSTTPFMTEFARQHLKAADTALSINDTAAALDLLTLAEFQIALIEMEPERAEMTEAQISEFVQRDTMSDGDSGTDYCLMNIDGVVQCRYPR